MSGGLMTRVLLAGKKVLGMGPTHLLEADESRARWCCRSMVDGDENADVGEKERYVNGECTKEEKAEVEMRERRAEGRAEKGRCCQQQSFALVRTVKLRSHGFCGRNECRRRQWEVVSVLGGSRVAWLLFAEIDDQTPSTEAPAERKCDAGLAPTSRCYSPANSVRIARCNNDAGSVEGMECTPALRWSASGAGRCDATVMAEGWCWRWAGDQEAQWLGNDRSMAQRDVPDGIRAKRHQARGRGGAVLLWPAVNGSTSLPPLF
ncbi:uncharacterized protein MYCFIDRAFT_178957 [Pseudocercospora fijiensis CIRAD86]|uniref:Uncharacterized protein n=1 Tax=Pseudocercospora fijiensis (strain CIRAD86) TaxID=383855 RepID=M2ZID2_PSEFD|nr:uncharacterized protein MYCFIDRAFT_178957 [Pseudocercospora fijiensis CIRAD86]EME78864.1 hypothetical protein MYCFIDRAFT_178957 [Pseudocercospora fijiensis CIRAD86]